MSHDATAGPEEPPSPSCSEWATSPTSSAFRRASRSPARPWCRGGRAVNGLGDSSSSPGQRATIGAALVLALLTVAGTALNSLPLRVLVLL
jgi:hypothetical protein